MLDVSSAAAECCRHEHRVSACCKLYDSQEVRVYSSGFGISDEACTMLCLCVHLKQRSQCCDGAAIIKEACETIDTN